MPARVAPVDEYCNAFYDWKRVIGEKVQELGEQLELVKAEVLKRFGEVPEISAMRDEPDKELVSLRYRLWNLESDLARWSEILGHINALMIPIVKSNYLARRLYDGEEHRTEKCPIHAGQWSGCQWGDQSCTEGCMSGSNVTGWLPKRHAFEAVDEFPGPDDHWTWGMEHPELRCKHCFGVAEALVHQPEKMS